MKYLFVIPFLFFAAGCSDTAGNREQSATMPVTGRIAEPPVSPNSPINSNTTLVSETENTAVVNIAVNTEQVSTAVSEKVNSVEQKVTETVNTVTDKVNSVAETTKRVCFGPNNTDCVEVNVKPKFEGTPVPKQ